MRFEIETELTFGKHAGQTIGWVLDNDPSYIVWMSTELLPGTGHTLCDITLDEAKKAVLREQGL